MPRLGLYQHPRVVVALANVADVFSSFADDFPIPEEFKALAQGHIEPTMPMAFTSKLKRAALVRKYESKWPIIERDLRDGHANGLSDAAKVGANGLWLELYALVWASERGKLRELPVMFSESMMSAFQHLRGKQRT